METAMKVIVSSKNLILFMWIYFAAKVTAKPFLAKKEENGWCGYKSSLFYL
jgi:hypothetical protein